jgi:hypothetical protein
VGIEAGVLADRVPSGSWRENEGDKRRRIELPCEEVFLTNVPRIRLSRLSELAPACFRVSGEGDPEVALPGDAVALAYRPVAHREEIAEGSSDEAKPTAEDAKTAETARPAAEEAPVPGWKKVGKPVPVSAATAEQKGSEADSVPDAAEPVKAPATVFAGGATLREQAELQRLLMTEEELTLQRVVDLAAALPGLRACVVIRNGGAIASREAPAGMDAVAVARWGVALRHGAPEGVRLDPAVTFYTPDGPLSCLEEGEIVLVVFHRDRGFLPGVREKLGEVLRAVSMSFD